VHTIVPNGKVSAAAAHAPETAFVARQFEPPLKEPAFFDDLVEVEPPAPSSFENLQTAEQEYQPYSIEDEPEAEPDDQDYYDDRTMPQGAPTTGPLEMPPFYEGPEQQELDRDERVEDHEQKEEACAEPAALEPAEANTAAVATDPWDDPLPAWDYSRNEWPMMVEAERPGWRRGLRAPLLIILALASVTALYYFVYRPLAGDGRAQETAATVSNGKAIATAPDEPAQTTAQPATGAATVESSAAMTANPPPVERDQVEGKYTLQVAALPDEASARDYSERLMRAGISTYIVPVENGRRRFFRVRVGRFESAEEAQRYAAQSRMRARAAGLTLSMMVVEYAKP
jgi:cell division septation protein DedD